MKVLLALRDATTRPKPPGGSDARLRGGWLLLARVGWLAVAVAILGMDVIATPILFDQMQRACTASDICVNYQLTPAKLAGFHASGLSLNFYAAFGVALYSIGSLAYAVMAAVIFWRRPND